jgi:hypothetical protein
MSLPTTIFKFTYVIMPSLLNQATTATHIALIVVSNIFQKYDITLNS